jgi:RHS repeat-associated protein
MWQIKTRSNVRVSGQISHSLAGLNQNYFRDYDKDTGRYIESDPIGLKGGINTFAYVGANPLWFADPLGLTKCKCRAIGGGSRPDPPPGHKGLMPKTCRYSCKCDCKAQPIAIGFSAGASDTATCVGQIDPHYTQPGSQVTFESFEFDTTSIIDRYINPLAPPSAFMDLVEKQCPNCKQ